MGGELLWQSGQDFNHGSAGDLCEIFHKTLTTHSLYKWETSYMFTTIEKERGWENVCDFLKGL